MKNWKGKPFLLDEIFVKRLYRRHCSDVKLNCPKERLLILESMNCGWKVLCEFTGDELPTDKNGNTLDWPHENKKAEVTKKIFGTKENKDTRVNRFLKAEAKGNMKRYFKKTVIFSCF